MFELINVNVSGFGLKASDKGIDVRAAGSIVWEADSSCEGLGEVRHAFVEVV